MDRIQAFIPALQWLPNYNKEDLSGDVSAGMIVAVMLIPQGMAYAMLAGLPPVIGLYSATIPLFVYALLGSSKQLAVGLWQSYPCWFSVESPSCGTRNR